MQVAQFSCECGKVFTWKPEIAGRRAKCKCGRTLQVLAESPLKEVEADPFAAEGYVEQAAMEAAAAPPSYALPPLPSATPQSPPAVQVTPAQGIDWASLNWKGSIWVVGATLLFLGLSIYHIIDPHDPGAERGTTRRGRGINSILHGIYEVGGNGAIIGLFMLLAIGCGVVSWWSLKKSDEAES